MSVLDIFRRPLRMAEFASSPAATSMQLVTPNQSSVLPLVVYSEFFAGEVGEVNRLAAMQIPAMKRGRDILVGVVAGMELVQLRDAADVTPGWLRNSASGVSPWHRMAATIDDLIWYDWSAWAVERDGDQIADGVRIPFERWSVDDAGRVFVDERKVSAEQIILIPGNGSGGLLAAGAQTIKGYKALERAWIGRAQNPIPLIELHQVGDDQLTDGSEDPDDNEVRDLITDWSAARTSPTGAVGFTDNRVEVRVHGTVQTDLYEQARNAAVLDVARLLNMPAALLDGAMSTASLTYVTTEGKQSEFDTLTLPSWTNPIEARLSLDDVAPAGEVIRFDRSQHVSITAPTVDTPTKD